MNLNEMVDKLEALMSEEVGNDLNALTGQLSRACTYLALQGRIMGLATHQFDLAKGGVASELRDHDLKLDVLRLTISGKLAKESAIYERAERTVKALTTYIEGLRTLISAEKSLTQAL